MKNYFSSLFSNHKVLENECYHFFKKVPIRCCPLCSMSGTGTVIKQNVIEPVDLAYVSYESTESVPQTPPLLIMHCLCGSKANWTTTSRALQKETKPQRKIIVVDARNHGDSPHSDFHKYEHLAEDVKTLMNKMDVKKAALLGHSMGGRAMMYTALKYPDLVEKLISVDISPIRTTESFKAAAQIMQAMQNVKFPTRVTLEEAKTSADMQLAMSIHNKLVRSFVLTNLVEESNGKFAWRVNIPGLLRNRKYIFSFPDVKGLTYSGPTLFITGKLSDFVQEKDHKGILELFPKAEFRSVDNSGHWVHNEKPKEFLNICTDFLSK
ncbi:protein ABHD11-like [Agrilus planipennis]|uniref:sn-1-specific diacylglycerol lipase ABHD11 n=1 Tax=Agrilus planipennis TaxID=224129 RepID=A0A1W4XIB9_AGRPL|nr:protein ABHD11-like [Agrilus planipennis]XP_025834196.1 protein ABHD11-like [Agrilus planipennis]